MNSPQYTIEVVIIVLLALIINGITGIFNSIFQARDKIIFQSIGQIIGSVILFTGVLLGIYFKFELLQFAFIF